MTTSIYYFSATGNSLHFAKQLARELKTNNLTSIAEALTSETIEISADRVGFVFPAYAWGPPRIVMDFLQKIEFKSKPYIFSVVTCAGIPAKTNITVKNELKKKKVDLDAGFIIKANRSSLIKKNTLDRIIISLDKQRKIIQRGEERLPEIISTIEKREKHKPETSSGIVNIFGTMFHNFGINYFKVAANSFNVHDSCTGCGTCVRLCPRANIILEEGHPQFSDNCEFCHACIQWCPKFAISHPDFENDPKQYRHPKIKLNDLIVNA